jgi:predicted SAM-dependent methyltransferase
LQSSTRIANLGCGSSMYGTDRLDFIKTDATTLVCDLEKGIPFPDETFDIVCSQSFLEHLTNVGFHLKECYRVLKKDGLVDVTTDNAACARFYWKGIATHGGRYERLHPGDHHYSVHTKQHLLNHFGVAGFRNIQINYVKTDTIGKWLDLVTFQKPRIRVWAMK